PATGRPAPLEVRVAHRPVREHRSFHARQHAPVALEPMRPARMPDAIVEHRAPPPWQRRRGHETRGVRPVLEEQPTIIDESIQPRAIVGAEPAPQREVVRALEDVDRIHRDAADVLREATETPGRQRGGARARQLMPLDEQRADGAQRKQGAWHLGGDYHCGAFEPEGSTMPCDPAVFEDIPIFSLLDADERAVLADQVELRRFHPRQRIYKAGEQGEKAYVMLSGKVAVVVIDEDNQEVVFDTPAVGEVFGLASMLSTAPHQT